MHAFQAILKHFWRFLLVWSRKIQFLSKSNNNIKNLSREILDMDSWKFQLEGFDYSFNTEGWKIRGVKLNKCFFKHQSSLKLHEARTHDICGRLLLFEIFFKNVSGCHVWMKLKLWDPRNTSEPITHHCEAYKVNLGDSNFSFKKMFLFRILNAFQAILKHFWRFLLMWSRKIQFFQKIITISKIWPERF